MEEDSRTAGFQASTKLSGSSQLLVLAVWDLDLQYGNWKIWDLLMFNCLSRGIGIRSLAKTGCAA